MEPSPEMRKLLHDIDSKTSSIKSAAKLLRECEPQERKEMLTLMKAATQELMSCLLELERQNTEQTGQI